MDEQSSRRTTVPGGWTSDGQSEGADNAVHGLVLPPHGAAPCGQGGNSRKWAPEILISYSKTKTLKF